MTGSSYEASLSSSTFDPIRLPAKANLNIEVHGNWNIGYFPIDMGRGGGIGEISMKFLSISFGSSGGKIQSQTSNSTHSRVSISYKNIGESSNVPVSLLVHPWLLIGRLSSWVTKKLIASNTFSEYTLNLVPLYFQSALYMFRSFWKLVFLSWFLLKKLSGDYISFRNLFYLKS